VKLVQQVRLDLKEILAQLVRQASKVRKAKLEQQVLKEISAQQVLKEISAQQVLLVRLDPLAPLHTPMHPHPQPIQ
jgi:hypothetical protein